VSHRYSSRDIAASRRLMEAARAVLRRAGAWACYQHQIRTFSHAVGTVRMGRDPRTSALDEFGGFRGIDNLVVLDGSFMPRSGGVNPSLTIAANALRSAAFLAASTSGHERSRHARATR
jgi:choline dehydrogenase-like flavoprotein